MDVVFSLQRAGGDAVFSWQFPVEVPATGRRSGVHRFRPDGGTTAPAVFARRQMRRAYALAPVFEAPAQTVPAVWAMRSMAAFSIRPQVWPEDVPAPGQKPRLIRSRRLPLIRS